MIELPGLHETVSSWDNLANQENSNQLDSDFVKGHKTSESYDPRKLGKKSRSKLDSKIGVYGVFNSYNFLKIYLIVGLDCWV